MKNTKSKPTDFSVHAPHAQAVFLAGSFNDWNTQTIPLVRQRDGHWHGVVPLHAGRHEFKFIVDGQWCCEADCEPEYQGCPERVPNQFGTMNRVLKLS